MSEPCLLRLKDPKSKKIRMILAVHVDDMIVAGSKRDCDWLHSALSQVFPVQQLGGAYLVYRMLIQAGCAKGYSTYSANRIY